MFFAHLQMRIYFSLMLAGLCLSLNACTATNILAGKNMISPAPGEQSPPEKLDLMAQQAEFINTQLDLAENALYSSKYQAATEYYQQILVLQPDHLRANEGLSIVSMLQRHEQLLQQAEHFLQSDSEEETLKAMDLLRQILIENPFNARAESLYKNELARVEAERIESMRIKLDYDSHVTLEFRDTELKIIIEALAKGTGINFTLDRDVPSDLRASLFVQKMALEEAIDILVQSNGLRKKVLSEDTILIYPDTTAKVRQYQDLIVRSFYLEYANPSTIAGLLRSMLGIRQIEVDDRLPMVMIKDVPEVMILVEKLIASQDLPEPEVMLELEIIEVSRTSALDAGILWPAELTVISGQNALTLEALRNTSSENIRVSPNPSLILDGRDSQVNLLANPRIRVKNRDSARIHIGDRLPIITSNVSSTGVISENVQYIDVGLKLNVTPTISLGGEVNINLDLDVSSVGNSITTNSGSVVFQIGTRSASTQLRLRDGETQVLAGLINDSDRRNINKVPGLGDLPFLGKLFSRKGDETTKTELMLSITPRIIRSMPERDASVEQYWVGAETQAGRSFVQPRSQEDISKLFRAGTPPGAPRSSPEPQASDQMPEGLNIQLPPGLLSDF